MAREFPGLPTVINGNGAVAYVASHVCGGVIGYPITPSTEISENYERFRAAGGVNVWGRHPFFYEPEGEHSAQSGALAAALTGGKYISNASSSQGILYALESHYVTVGKKVGGFVLHVAARVVTKHSLNVMAGHDDVHALLPAGYTILFGADPQEAADFAAISYRIAADSLVPVANAMDGFATSHMTSEALLPEPELLKRYLGDPSERIPCPTLAQEVLHGAKGRVYQLKQWATRHADAFAPADLASLRNLLDERADVIETDRAGALIAATEAFVPAALMPRWRRLWLNAWEKGTRMRVPALVDPDNPGLTGAVQNQPDYQAGVVDHHVHFLADVPRLAAKAFEEFGELTGRRYAPVMTYACEDAETVLIGLGSVTSDAEAVAEWMRRHGRKVGVVAIKQLQPFPEAELIAAIAGKRAVTVLERSDVTALSDRVSRALVKARENAESATPRHPGVPALAVLPRMTTAIFGLGGHDLQPRHLIAAYDAMDRADAAPFVWLGSRFTAPDAPAVVTDLHKRLAAAYPERLTTVLETGDNPSDLLPDGAMRIRFHSVGGYGTVATGKLATDILSGLLGLHSKSAPKYGSEKSGAPTNFYITLSPDPVKITNAELEDVEIVLSADHKVFSHTDPLKGLVHGGTFVLQTNLTPHAAWEALPARARAAIREREVHFMVLDAFAVAARHAPTPELATRMMGIAFIGALAGRVDRVAAGLDRDAALERIRKQIDKKFGAKGKAVVEGNMQVIREGLEATLEVPWNEPDYGEAELVALAARARSVDTRLAGLASRAAPSGLFDPIYFDAIVGKPMREGTIGEAPVMPGSGLFLPPGSAAAKDKGLFRRQVPAFEPEKCTGCLECALVCPDAALPVTVHEIADLLATAAKATALPADRAARLVAVLPAVEAKVRIALVETSEKPALSALVAGAAASVAAGDADLAKDLGALAETLSWLPVARTNLFFDQFEKKAAGSGGLLSIGIDPSKCSGCLECLTVCGGEALSEQVQDDDLYEEMQTRFALLSQTQPSPRRFVGNLAGPEAKRFVLDREAYYATTGGHGACRGCGEATVIRQISSTVQALGTRRVEGETAEIEMMLADLEKARIGAEGARAERIDRAAAVLEKRLFTIESGPTGGGRAPMVVANATGCSSVYCSTFPANPYRAPWVNSLFQDTPAVAKGLFEGLAADFVEVVRARRIAALERDGAYDPARHDKAMAMLSWADFTDEELALMPTILSMGGDGATYDIGFGALSKLLTTHTPIKVVVLNTGAYSNTGGQASTSSFLGQDSDLASVGAAHAGKTDDRKELGLIAAFHPKVMVVQSTPAMQGHFLKNVLAALDYRDGPVVIDVHTPCQGENGIGDAVASGHARLAVRSRVSPLFVHDPRVEPSARARLSLAGNPDAEQDWTTVELEWDDADGVTQTMEVPLTPADFAHEEGRFKKQFQPRPMADDVAGVPIHEWIDLPAEERAGRVPFLYQVIDRKLVRFAVPDPIVRLVEERRRNWRLLRHLAGRDAAKAMAERTAEAEAIRARYDELAARLATLTQATKPAEAAANADPDGHAIGA